MIVNCEDSPNDEQSSLDVSGCCLRYLLLLIEDGEDGIEDALLFIASSSLINMMLDLRCKSERKKWEKYFLSRLSFVL